MAPPYCKSVRAVPKVVPRARAAPLRSAPRRGRFILRLRRSYVGVVTRTSVVHSDGVRMAVRVGALCCVWSCEKYDGLVCA